MSTRARSAKPGLRPEAEAHPGLRGAQRVAARAWLLGEGIDPREVPGTRMLTRSPFTLESGEGDLVVLFRFGAAVAFRAGASAPQELPGGLRALVNRPFATPESDDAVLRVAATDPEGPDLQGELTLAEATLERLHVVAEVLARSAFLAHFEAQLSSSLDQLEPVAEQLRRAGSAGLRGRRLLRELGDVLVSEMRMVGRVEVSEKPERIWDRADLDELYVRLAEEYELQSRDRAVTRKLDLLSRSARTFLEILTSRRSLNVEWYIVILILLEIVILVYDLFGR